MPCMHCFATKVTDGSARVLPFVRRKLPLDRVKPALRWAVMPALIVGTVVLVFTENTVMWVVVPAWLFLAHKLGRSTHCPPKEPGRDRKKVAEDSGDSDQGQQSEEERTADASVPGER